MRVRRSWPRAVPRCRSARGCGARCSSYAWAWAWACIQARTSDTFHAVIASPNFVGAGKDWARTFLHKVAAENGKGVGRFGRLGSRTSWDRRAYAVSASSSKLGIASVTRCATGWRGFLALGAVVFSVNLFSPWCAAGNRGLWLLAARLLELRRTRRMQTIKLAVVPYTGNTFGKF